MKVLFIASGNKKVGTVSSFVRSQYESLQGEGLDMMLFPVVGHGWLAYARAIFKVRELVRRERPDIVHAHYSTCGFVASLATLFMFHRPKIVVSILGSFPTHSAKWRRVRWGIRHLWDATLTKSKRTSDQLGIALPVIPNGVNLDIFYPQDYQNSRKEVGFESGKKYVVWCSNPERLEKNWPLARLAIQHLNSKLPSHADIQLVPVYNKTPQEVALYMNAADCLLLTSWSEGSPNVIKEAMACNCPIVTTDVGDVNERLENLEGCFVAKTPHPVTNPHTHTLYAEENAAVLAECLSRALAFGQRTKGRDRILADGLTIGLTAKKIINWYGQSLQNI